MPLLLGACDRPPAVSPVPPLTTADPAAHLALEPATEPFASPAPVASSPAPSPPPPPSPPPSRCEPASWRSALHSCAPLEGRIAAKAQGNYWPAARAVDRDSCTAWNSGGYAPQAITLDLGEPRPIGHVVLVPEMTPDGAVVHVVEVSSDGVRFEARARYEGTMVGGGVYEVALSPPALARYLRVLTERSPSWVAWNEIVPVGCAGQHPTPPGAPGVVAPVALPIKPR